MRPLTAAVAAAWLAGCFNFGGILPPLPSTQCTTFIAITQLVASDGGTAQVTLGCNQAPASACDGGVAPACATSACVEVDWVGVAASYNGNCSQASPQGLAASAFCTELPTDAGLTVSFIAPASVPAPELVFAHLTDAGAASGCDSSCAQAAATCACNEALAGTEGQSCTALK